MYTQFPLVMIASKLRHAFSRFVPQRRVLLNLQHYFPKSSNYADIIKESFDDIRVRASEFKENVIFLIKLFTYRPPKEKLSNRTKKEVQQIKYQRKLTSEMDSMLIKYEENLIIDKYPHFSDDLIDFDCYRQSNHYSPISGLRELQESEPEKYGPFENDEKIQDFLKIYDSSNFFFFYMYHYQFGTGAPIIESDTKEYLEKIKQFTAKYAGYEELNQFIDQNFNEKLYEMARRTEKANKQQSEKEANQY